jgi:hypothetical protein
MDAATRQLIEALHREGRYQYVMALTGGGTGAAAQLLNVPGGSRTLLEVIVPYHERALAEFLGRSPDQYCSADTSRLMAGRALDRARWLAPGHLAAGIGCTASLATDRPKRGDHRFHFTVRTDFTSRTCSLTLAKGARDRAGEEAVLDALLLGTMLAEFGVGQCPPVALLPGERVEEDHGESTDLAGLVGLLKGAGQVLCVAPDGCVQASAPPPAVLLAGAFNPLHRGHRDLAQVAAAALGAPVAFELSVRNVDKATLGIEEVRLRLRQFQWLAPVWLTSAPTFAEKALLFPGVTFLLGADTAVRLFAPRYYEGGEAGMAAAFDTIRRQGCRFLVACRVDGAGQCQDLDGLGVPGPWRDLFQAIPAEQFRVDVSSTQLRQQPRPTPPPS